MEPLITPAVGLILLVAFISVVALFAGGFRGIIDAIMSVGDHETTVQDTNAAPQYDTFDVHTTSESHIPALAPIVVPDHSFGTTPTTIATEVINTATQIAGSSTTTPEEEVNVSSNPSYLGEVLPAVITSGTAYNPSSKPSIPVVDSI